MKATMMAIISLLTGGLLLLLGLQDYRALQQTLQTRNKAEYTGALAEFHCSTERRQSAVKLRLAQHPPTTWFYTDRGLLGLIEPCKVLQRAATSQANMTVLAAHSQIIRLNIADQLIYRPQDWRKHHLKNAIGAAVIGALLMMSGSYMFYRRRNPRRQTETIPNENDNA